MLLPLAVPISILLARGFHTLFGGKAGAKQTDLVLLTLFVALQAIHIASFTRYLLPLFASPG